MSTRDTDPHELAPEEPEQPTAVENPMGGTSSDTQDLTKDKQIAALLDEVRLLRTSNDRLTREVSEYRRQSKETAEELKSMRETMDKVGPILQRVCEYFERLDSLETRTQSIERTCEIRHEADPIPVESMLPSSDD